jgi:hypothetical protein
MFTNSISRHWRSSVLGWITSAQHVRLRSMWEASTSVSDVITGPTLNHYGCGPTGGAAASSQEIWTFEHAQCVELARGRLCHRLGRLSAGSGPVPHRHRGSRTRDGVGRQIPQRRETIALVGRGRRQRPATRIGYSDTGPTQSAPTRTSAHLRLAARVPPRRYGSGGLSFEQLVGTTRHPETWVAARLVPRCGQLLPPVTVCGSQ